MARDVSPALSTSTLSTIEVRMDDVSTRSSVDVPSSATPPTSFGESPSDGDAATAKGRRHSSRAGPRVSTHNGSAVASTAVHAPKSSRKHARGVSRSVSGATLVEDNTMAASGRLLKDGTRSSKSTSPVTSQATGSKSRRTSGSPRKSTHVARLETAASTVLDAVVSTTSALGKRSRRVFENAKESLQEAVTDRRKSLRVENAINTGEGNGPEGVSFRLFPNLKTQQEPEVVKEKKQTQVVSMRRKKFVTCGLYSGQHWAFNPRLTESKNRKKIQQTTADAESESIYVREASHPMFYMEKLFELERDFRLPFDILKPLPKEQAPKDWHRLNKNRFIGDAAATWKRVYTKLPLSTCICTPETGCDDDCLNRMMQYECNDSNCTVGDRCGNRAFAELAWRSRGKNFSRKPPRPEGMTDKEYEALRKEMGLGVEPNLWHEGVEVMKTKDRGYGVRSMRTFAPGQVIVEYCGEIITPEEADRRMNEEYKDKTDFYLMTFHDGLIIDATRGSICRFVNHSCEPNCRVEKWTVDGEPRMALFAGDNGIAVGEELTYDYNFDPFSKKNIQTCRCGSANCRGVLGPKPTKDANRAAKAAAAAASNVVKGVKRKLKEVFGDDDIAGEDDHSTKRKRVLPDPKALLKKATKQLTNITTGSSASTSTKLDETQNESRAKRAARRSSSTVTLSSQTEIKLSKTHSRSTVRVSSVMKTSRQSVTEDLSLSRSNSKSVSPKKMLQNVVNKIKDSSSKALQPITGKSNLKTLEDHNSSSSTSQLLPKKQLKQSKLSFGGGGLGFEDPDTMDVNEEENAEQEDIETKPKEKKGGRSFAASVRSSAVRSVKGPQRAAAMMRIGLRGNEAVRKTIRQVSGAEDVE